MKITSIEYLFNMYKPCIKYVCTQSEPCDTLMVTMKYLLTLCMNEKVIVIVHDGKHAEGD